MPRLCLPIILLFLLPGLNACSDSTAPALESPGDSGILKVVSRNSSTTYYLDRHEQAIGPEYQLVTDFAAAQGWDVEWTLVDSTAAVLATLEEGRVHLAAAGLTHLPERDERFHPGAVHTRVSEQLVCSRSLRQLPDSPADMVGLTIRVTAESSYIQTLTRLQEAEPAMEFEADNERTTEVLLADVASGEVDCTVADSNIVQVMRRQFPALSIAMDLREGEQLGWYTARGQRSLARQSRRWIDSGDGELSVTLMQQRYYNYIGDFDFVDFRALNRRIADRLPRYMDVFVSAEEQTGMPADLLAALAYQESHWDPQAVSPTGVRGIMMLTQNTASDVGVSNRLDPEQSIFGGARYLADRHARLPEDIPEPDRTFLALASYNIGRGHLLDARQLARELGKDPDSWVDMRQVLPLKADKRYYPDTRYGYARGYEPVHYVQRIRNYRDVIAPAFTVYTQAD
ncbi:membrane-bound lytic murein transglycosylase MltF [Halopseudomonas salegens]|uniref:Membrane-bound lytic murein transglycosylase F n=1 Tax=Halopseudomonas salegens TaxID=1434072 RepID=A0A1H2EDF6_9GAMM|nr:membrane-bound lytic murein transglycosylase MltF [Halopseudomonas salegens]SDT92788.1 membrane-bound lytic murein transglycosylase F [Halopseudomonas salegens]